MLALTVKQPWAWAIVSGRKPTESREWSTQYRGPLLIHSSRSPLEPGTEFKPPRGELFYGHILGAVQLISCIHSPDGKGFLFGLGSPIVFPNPVHYSGNKGLFNIPLEVVLKHNQPEQLGWLKEFQK